MTAATRSDALMALVHELVDLDAEIARAAGREDEARQEFVVARQTLDGIVAERALIQKKRDVTDAALELVQARDDVSHETIEALMVRAAR